MSDRAQQRVAALALAGAGLAAGTSQVVLLRELLKIAAGNELTLGIMLAAWLLWSAAGAGLAARIAGRRSADEGLLAGPRCGMAIVSYLFYPLAYLCVRLIRETPAILGHLPGGLAVQPGEVMGLAHLGVTSLLSVLPVAAATGLQFGLAMRLYAQLRGDGRAVSLCYAYDALGHLAGGAAAALLLAAGVSALPILAPGGLAILWGGALASGCRATPQWRPGRRRLALLAAISVCLAAWSAYPLPSALQRRAEVLTEVESAHGNLAVARNGPGNVTFYLNGVPEAFAPPTPHIQYLVHFPLLQLPPGSRPRRLLLVGGGATGGLAQALQYPGLAVDYVELDPALIRLARRYTLGADRAALADPRVRVEQLDGRLFVKRLRAAGERYDAVLLSLPDPSTAQVNRFYTRDFFAEVARVLRPEGVLGLQFPSSDTYLGEELLRLNAVLLKAVGAVFPRMALLPGDPVVVAASRMGRLTEEPEVLRQRYDRLGLQAADFRAHVADRLFPLTVQQYRDALAAAPPLPANTDRHPVGYFYDQAYWVAQHSRGSWRVFAWLSGLTLRRLALPLLLVAAALLVSGGLFRRSRRLHVPLAIFGTGWVAMALELVLLFAFQVQCGYVYQLLGVLTGAFMVGLAGGGLAAGRVAAAGDRARCRRVLCLLEGAVAAVAALLPALLWGVGAVAGLHGAAWLAPYVLFPLLAMLVGAVVGAQFPLAAHAAASPGEAARAGTLLYAADLAGGALGALLAGAALIPVLGLPQTCYLAAGVSAGLAALLALRE